MRFLLSVLFVLLPALPAWGQMSALTPPAFDAASAPGQFASAQDQFASSRSRPNPATGQPAPVTQKPPTLQQPPILQLPPPSQQSPSQQPIVIQPFPIQKRRIIQQSAVEKQQLALKPAPMFQEPPPFPPLSPVEQSCTSIFGVDHQESAPGPTPIATAPRPLVSQEEPQPAPTIEGLAKSVEVLGKNLTVVTGDEQIKLVVGGVISADFYYNHARPLAPGLPFFLTPASPFGFDQNTFDANARATTIFLAGKGPMIGQFESGGLVALTLFNDALVVDRYGILPIQAFAELKNDDWRVAAGLQFDIFNPLNPNTLTFAYLAGSGNAGMGFPGQFRVERFFHLANDTQATLTLGLSEPISTTVNNALRISEDNGWPNLEARASIAAGPLQGEGPLAKRALEAGVSGVVGQIRTTQGPTRVVSDIWGLGTDARWSINPCFGFQGELFVGQTLGTYTAGILQNVNASNFHGVHSAGGWFEVFYYLCPDKLHTHVGYGIDDPLDSDLARGQPVRNETYFVNLVWDVTKHLRLGCELTYRRTEYTILRSNEGLGVQTQMQWRF